MSALSQDLFLFAAPRGMERYIHLVALIYEKRFKAEVFAEPEIPAVLYR